MDKSNFKKMALMGMAAGTLLTAQTPVNADIVDNVQSMIIAKGCGGPSGCSNRSSCSNRNSCSGSSRPRQSYTADATPSSTQQQPHQMQYNQQPSQAQHNQYQNSRHENLSESEFISQLNDEGKAIFRGLDAEGKALALRLAQENYSKDKNQIVRLAAQKIAEQRAGRPDAAHHGYGY